MFYRLVSWLYSFARQELMLYDTSSPYDKNLSYPSLCLTAH